MVTVGVHPLGGHSEEQTMTAIAASLVTALPTMPWVVNKYLQMLMAMFGVS